MTDDKLARIKYMAYARNELESGDIQTVFDLLTYVDSLKARIAELEAELEARVAELVAKLVSQASSHGMYVTQTLEPKIDELKEENARLQAKVKEQAERIEELYGQLEAKDQVYERNHERAHRLAEGLRADNARLQAKVKEQTERARLWKERCRRYKKERDSQEVSRAPGVENQGLNSEQLYKNPGPTSTTVATSDPKPCRDCGEHPRYMNGWCKECFHKTRTFVNAETNVQACDEGER